MPWYWDVSPFYGRPPFEMIFLHRNMQFTYVLSSSSRLDSYFSFFWITFFFVVKKRRQFFEFQQEHCTRAYEKYSIETGYCLSNEFLGVNKIDCRRICAIVHNTVITLDTKIQGFHTTKFIRKSCWNTSIIALHRNILVSSKTTFTVPWCWPTVILTNIYTHIYVYIIYQILIICFVHDYCQKANNFYDLNVIFTFIWSEIFYAI